MRRPCALRLLCQALLISQAFALPNLHCTFPSCRSKMEQALQHFTVEQALACAVSSSSSQACGAAQRQCDHLWDNLTRRSGIKPTWVTSTHAVQQTSRGAKTRPNKLCTAIYLLKCNPSGSFWHFGLKHRRQISWRDEDEDKSIPKLEMHMVLNATSHATFAMAEASTQRFQAATNKKRCHENMRP